jgi:virulence-associated protein VagC
MSGTVLYADTLNLPEVFNHKLKGMKVELIESDDTIIIRPIFNAISAARGMMKGGNLNLDKFMAQKQAEKELEYGG